MDAVERLNGDERDKVLAKLLDAPETPEPDVAEECHRRLVALRAKTLGEADRLRQSSTMFYYLCDVLSGTSPVPEAFLTLDVPTSVSPRGADQHGRPVQLVDAEGRPTDLLNSVFEQYGNDYFESWKNIKKYAGEAVEACELLEKMTSEEAPVAEG